VNRKLLLALAMCAAATPMTATAQPSNAQRVTVTLIAADGRPASGALVAIVDRNGQVVADGLTNSLGERTLLVSPGSYRARVLRIGYEPTWSDWTTVARDVRIDITLNDARINLNTLVVRTRTTCRVDQDPRGTGLLWAEVTKALRSSQLASSDAGPLSKASVYRKIAESEGWILSADTTWVAVRDKQPYSAIDPALLAKDGYVRGSVTAGFEFFGPDEKVLLSNEFAGTHCFRLERDPARAGLVGLAFEPAPGRRVADIAGTIWVDEQTSELKEIRFSYVRAGLPRDFNAGGFTKFRRLDSGTWIVSSWELRMPRVDIRRIPYGRGFPDREIAEVVGSTEFGGGVVLRELPDIEHRRAGTRINGIAFDSVSGRPLIGAIVRVAELTHETDSAGRFVFQNVAPGPHTMMVSHLSLSSLGYVGVQQDIYAAGDSMFIPVATPSARRTWDRLCRSVPFEERNWRGVVYGLVVNDAGEPVGNSPVVFNWQVIPSPTGPSASIKADLRPVSLQVTTDSSGRYAACGFVAGSTGTVSIHPRTTNSQVARFAVTDSRFVRVDLRGN
jgi:hypothetical protein